MLYRSTSCAFAVLILGLSACATPAEQPPAHTGSVETPMTRGLRTSASVGDGATRVLFRDRSMASILDELSRHQQALEQILGTRETDLTRSIDALVDQLGEAFADELTTSYDALTPAQQGMYNEVLVLVEELRMLVGRTLMGGAPPPAASPRRAEGRNAA
ncbi:MAG: hypothetical protein R2834_17160 [Rhodothermales bacterium]